MDGWVWGNGGKILSGQNWKTGRTKLYNVGRRWIEEYGAIVKGIERVKLKYWEKNILQCGWLKDGWLCTKGGMLLIGESWNTGR